MGDAPDLSGRSLSERKSRADTQVSGPCGDLLPVDRFTLTHPCRA
ncbi:hypothetical protein [Streptomyces daliensis]